MVQDLIVQFNGIEQAPGTFPDDGGLVGVTVTNYGDRILTDDSVNIFASTERELDLDNLNSNSDLIAGTQLNELRGTEELLGTLDGVNLAPNESRSFTIDFASPEFNNPSVVSPGAYFLFAQVDPANIAPEINEANNQDIQFVSGAGTDAILDWNSLFLNAVQTQGKLDRANGVPLTDTSVPGVAPPIEARDAAISAIAQYEAVNAISSGDASYLGVPIPPPPPGASAEAAAVGAGYRVLSALFPEQQATFDLQIPESGAEINDSEGAKALGFSYGVFIADQILAQREDDGVDVAQVPYTPGIDPGDYDETHEGGTVSALLPNFGNVTPFAIDDVANFRPDGPSAYGSEQFIRETEQIRLYGGRTDTETTVLEDFFGEDVSFTISSQELPGVTRTFDGIGELSSFDQAALENANSRLYAGVHIDSSNLDGLATGQLVGEYVAENFFA